MMKKFILLSTQRTGSSWVIDLLSSHPAIEAYEELFLKGKEKLVWVGSTNILPWHVYNQQQAVWPRKLMRPLLYSRYLDYVFATKKADIQAIGFKLMYSQLRHHPEILLYLWSHRVYIIHLVRENSLDIILSRKARDLRGVAHSQGTVQDVKIYLNPSDLLKKLKWYDLKTRLARRFLTYSRLPLLEVTYENLTSNVAAIDRILDFLNIDSGRYELRASLQKLNKRSHKELIENYDDVYDVLKATDFAHMLH